MSNTSPSAALAGASRTNGSRPPSSADRDSEQQQQQQKQSRNIPHEERLSKLRRMLMTGILDMYQKAETAAKETTEKSLKELNESVKNNFFQPRIEYHRSIGHVEALLQGKEQEREALESYLRSQPRLGKRKREDDSAELQSSLAATVQQTPPSTSAGSIDVDQPTLAL